MTEAEWLAAAEPEPMLRWLQGNGLISRHKLAVLFESFCECLRPLIANEPAPIILNWHDEDSQLAMTDAMQHISDAVLESIRMFRRKTGDCSLLAANIRDIFGNPFGHTTLNPSWLTSTILALGQQMYDSRDFSPMPILADALQDAGCDSGEMLNHCRGEGVHIRGCWVIDLLTGRK
jgi:hypothetical protein